MSSTWGAGIPNTNRIVNIKRTSDSGFTWKNNLSSILSSYDSSTKFINIDSALRNLDVENDVELLMEKGFPSFDFKNEIKHPLKDFFSKSNLAKTVETAGKGIEILSTIKNALDSGSNNTDLITGTSWNPWMLNIPALSPNDNVELSFNYSFSFALGQYGLWNAKKEVALPVLNLIAPVLPQNLTPYSTSPPFPRTSELLTRVLTEGVLSAFTDSDSLSDSLQNLIFDGYNNFTFDVSFGTYMTLRQCLITEASVSFGGQVDEKGYPVTADVTLTFKSIIPPSLTASSDKLLSIRFGGINQ